MQAQFYVFQEIFSTATNTRGDHIQRIDFKAHMDDGKTPENVLSWRNALLVGTSALLSGIAVVIWNRRALQKIRENVAASKSPGGTGEGSRPEEEFI